MNALLATARAVHIAATLWLFGEFVFLVAVARPAWRDVAHAAPDASHDVHRRLLVAASLSIIASIASGVTWLVAEAAVMSGMPLAQAINPHTLGLVLGKTVFGQVWVLRFGLVVALCALLLAMGRSASGKRKLRLALVAIVVAAAYLAALAWAGHAAAGQGPERFVRIVSDVIHLLAAGAWLGALPGLVFFLTITQPFDAAARATRRFSILGMVSVSALVLSGLANAWYLVGDVPSLAGTAYGRLLLAKLALFVAMVTLAMVNRMYLTPRVADDRGALRSLRRNAMLETAVGLLVVAIVGVLGITIPGTHQSPIWPFDHTLSWQAAEQSAWVGAALGAAATVACAAAGAVLGGVRSHRPRLSLAGLAGIVAAAATWAWLLAVPAYPTTYVASPVRYATDSIVRGATRYTQSCSTCHGPQGHGVGPAAPSLPTKPADLVEQASHHRAGNFFWWIAHGIPGTPMPGFAPHMSDVEIWDLIQFLHALSEAEDARFVTDRVEPWRPIVAPDFTFEITGHPQESLGQQLGQRPRHHVALVVLYTLPQSLPRLRALATKEQVFAEAGVRVIAVPLSTSATSADSETVHDGKSMFAITRPDVATVYAMFARRRVDSRSDTPAHVEFLIDRQGYLRARWIGVPDAETYRTPEILGQIELLSRERPRASALWGHAH